MYPDLKGKCALITGAGKRSGIGFAIAERLAANGTDILLADLGGKPQDINGLATGGLAEMETLARELAAKYQVRVEPLELDVTHMASAQAAARTVDKAFGRLDILINNAGATFGVPSALHDYEEAAWLRTLDVCLNGVYRVTKALVPVMRRTGGAIVNTASRAGKTPPIFNGAYAVAKAGVIMMTKVMAREMAGMGIRVNAVVPAQVATELEAWRFALEASLLGTTAARQEEDMCKTIPLGRIGKPSEIAALAVYLASEEASYITGQAVNVCGGQLMEL